MTYREDDLTEVTAVFDDGNVLLADALEAEE
jgi:hypothetical protein